jgi:hypothetical protein
MSAGLDVLYKLVWEVDTVTGWRYTKTVAVWVTGNHERFTYYDI